MTLGTTLALQEQRLRYTLARFYPRPTPEVPESETPTQTAEGWWHGSVYGYDKKKCRCVFCRAAKAKYWREWRARKRAETPAPTRTHSLYGYRHHGCRCAVCVSAYRASRATCRAQRRAIKAAMASAQMMARIHDLNTTQEASHAAVSE